jgi:hypothetical protein
MKARHAWRGCPSEGGRQMLGSVPTHVQVAVERQRVQHRKTLLLLLKKFSD